MNDVLLGILIPFSWDYAGGWLCFLSAGKAESFN